MNRREFLIAAASAAAVGLLFQFDRCGLAIAAAKPPKPRVETEILPTVTKVDGTTWRGKITAYDKDKITMDLVTRPKDPPVSTDVPWDDIRRISTGLTREKALQKWKQDHHDSLCGTCHGDGKVFCETCHGTAHDPAASANCPTCHGAAQIACTTAHCEHGIIPCPNPKCLKITDGGWVKKPDGMKWKKFVGKAGASLEVSEHHVGEVIEKVNGEWTNSGKCPICEGTTQIADPVCRGTGQMPCPTCAKKIKNPPCPRKCDNGLVPCPTCKGSGLKSA